MATETKTLIVNELLTCYTQSGGAKKPAIIFLHGWGDNKETFKALHSKISKDYQLVSVDLPGFGASQAPSETWGLDNYALFVGAFLEKLKINPAVILGHSNGGAVAVYGLAHGSFHTGKLILLASAGIRDVDQVKKQVLKALAKSAKLATKALPAKTQKKLKEKAYKKIGSELLLVPGMEETFKKTVAYDISNDAVQVKVPTLIVYGDADISTPHNFGEKLHGLIPYSKLLILPGMGHMLQQEDPEQIAKIINEFL